MGWWRDEMISSLNNLDCLKLNKKKRYCLQSLTRDQYVSRLAQILTDAKMAACVAPLYPSFPTFTEMSGFYKMVNFPGSKQ